MLASSCAKELEAVGALSTFKKDCGMVEVKDMATWGSEIGIQNSR